MQRAWITHTHTHTRTGLFRETRGDTSFFFFHRSSSSLSGLIIKAFPIYFQIKVRMGEDVVSLRSAGNLHDKATPPLSVFMSKCRQEEEGREGVCRLHVKV